MYNNNNRVGNFNTYTTLQGSFSFSKVESKKDSINAETKVFTKKQLRLEKQKLRRSIYHLQKDGKHEGGNKILGIIGIILLALVGIILVVGIACTLSCNGAGAAGAFVGIVGVVGILWLAAWCIGRLFRKKPAEEK